jgi:inner membrane protein
MRLPRFGGDAAPVWVLDAWGHEAFATYRWFAQVPVFLKAVERVVPVGVAQTGADDRRAQRERPSDTGNGLGNGAGSAGDTERCAAFRDLRFEFPGRETSPFRFALCLRGGEAAAGAARVIRLDGDEWPAK